MHSIFRKIDVRYNNIDRYQDEKYYGHIAHWLTVNLTVIRNYTAQKIKFSVRIYSVNVTKAAGNCGFGHIYWRNP